MRFLQYFVHPFFIFCAFLGAYIFIHIPFTKFHSAIQIEEAFFYSINEESKGLPSKVKDKAFSTFTFDVENKEGFEIYSLNSLGLLKTKFVLPSKKPVLPDDTLKSWPDFDGYITYPVNGNFFIWYPRLGRYVYYFDDKGNFLFEKESTHYLQSFSSGAYVLALAGDHSRAHFLKPGLQPVTDIEGMLLIDYKLSENKETLIQACAVFLDGDIVFVNPKKQKQYRLTMGFPVKSISCDFENNIFAFQAENRTISENNDKETEKNTDVIITAKLLIPADDKEEADYEIISKHELDKLYPETLPLSYNKTGYLIYMLPDYTAAIIYENQKYEINMKKTGSVNSNINDYRFINMGSAVILWNKNGYSIFQKDGLVDYRNDEIVHASVVANNFFLQ